MYILRFYQDNMPPVLNDGSNDIIISNYIIGAPNDPHWRMYPKDMFLTARNMFPIGQAFTNYSADNNHYIYYMPDNTGLTLTYSRLLREYFEDIHKYRQAYNRENKQKLIQERSEKAKQLEGLLKEQKQQLKKFKDELSKLKSNRDRALRSAVRSGVPKEIAEAEYDRMYPMYINTTRSIITIESNILSLKNELKTYTD